MSPSASIFMLTLQHWRAVSSLPPDPLVSAASAEVLHEVRYQAMLLISYGC